MMKQLSGDVLTIYYDTTIGVLGLSERDGALCALFFADKGQEADSGRLQETPVLKEAISQIRSYLAGELHTFSVPISETDGTPFQRKVWAALRDIPYGETRSYKDIAITVDSPQGFRAVGMANNKNPIAIITPCHRVIGTDGSLVGYASGLDHKTALLQLEQKYKK